MPRNARISDYSRSGSEAPGSLSHLGILQQHTEWQMGTGKLLERGLCVHTHPGVMKLIVAPSWHSLILSTHSYLMPSLLPNNDLTTQYPCVLRPLSSWSHLTNRAHSWRIVL